MYTRRTFISRSAGVVGGLTIISSVPILAACGDDDDADSTGTTPGTADATGTTPAAGTSPATSAAPTGTSGAVIGSVASVFNWLPDIEWSAWYLAEAKGHFAAHGVESSLIHGGPNTPAVVQVLAAGDGNVGLSASELDIIKANQEGSDFVVIGAMYQKNPLGLTWMTATGIETVQDLVGKRIGGPQGDQVQINALFMVNGLSPDDYEFIPMGFDPQPLVDGEMDAIASYVTNQPLQLRLQGHDVSAKPYSDLGLPSYGDILFASRAWLDENHDLVVAYLAGLLQGALDNRADPTESLPILLESYAADAEISEEYATLANPEYIALMDSPYTDEHGILSVDPARMGDEVLPVLETAGETDLPTVEEFLDTSFLEEAHAALS
jgi:ABC-type nitrate/sulfonate/bicarbonate transport system substrate-binding protein